MRKYYKVKRKNSSDYAVYKKFLFFWLFRGRFLSEEDARSYVYKDANNSGIIFFNKWGDKIVW